MLTSATFLLALGSAASADPFAFRGIPLGTPLSDFRKLPYPDASLKPKARVFCTGDADMAAKTKFTSFDIGADAKRTGILACRYYVPSKSAGIPGSQYLPEFVPAAPDFANIGGYETTFYFSPATLSADQARRLYMVVVTPKSEHFTTIVDALTSKYGVPTGRTSSPIKNRMGAEFMDEVASWQIDHSTILVRKYNDQIGQAIVTYSLDGVVAATNQMSSSLAAENAKKL